MPTIKKPVARKGKKENKHGLIQKQTYQIFFKSQVWHHIKVYLQKAVQHIFRIFARAPSKYNLKGLDELKEVLNVRKLIKLVCSPIYIWKESGIFRV